LVLKALEEGRITSHPVQDSDIRQLRKELSEKLNAFGGEFEAQVSHPGDISSRSR